MTAPVISAVAASGITSSSSTITWTTGESSTSQVDYGLDTSYGTVVSDSALVTAHSLTLTGLAASTPYHFQVTAVDAAGNPAFSGDLTFTTAAPTLMSIAVTPANPSVAAGATQQFTAIGTYSDATTADLTGDVTWASSLTAVATITAGGLATSIAEGTTSISATLGAVVGNATLTVPDTTPPVISSIVATPTSNSATITWTTGESATSQVDYGLDTSHGTVVSDSALVTSHSLNLTGLAASTLYHFQMTSVDAAGNPAFSGDLSFTTLPNTSPTASISSPMDGSTFLTTDIVIFGGSGNDTEDGLLTGASLTWTSSLDGPIGTGTSFDTSLIAGTHTITLTVTDSQGATGTASVDVTVDTPPDTPVDTVTITRARYEEAKSKLDVRATSSSGGSVTLTATAYDSDGSIMGSVTLDYEAKKDRYKDKITGLAFKPFRVNVVSSGGGSASVQDETIESKGD